MIAFDADGLLRIGDVIADRLDLKCETPMYVYDAGRIRENYRRIRDSIPYQPTEIHFAMMCNPNPHMLKILKEEGSGLFCQNGIEVEQGLRCGFEHEDIALAGSGLSDEDFQAAVDYSGLHGSRCRICADSYSQLGKIHFASNGELGLRVRVDAGVPRHTLNSESRVEFEPRDVLYVACHIQELGLSLSDRIVGLHTYIGTNIMKVRPFLRAADILLELADHLEDLEYIDIGSGFGHDYRTGEGFPFEVFGREVSKRMERNGRGLHLKIEPGRSIAADAGCILTEVVSRKCVRGRANLDVDLSPAHFQRYYVYSQCHRAVLVRRSRADLEPFDIGGTGALSNGYITRNVELPSDTAEGDVIAILDAGAYGYSMCSDFTGQKRPRQILVDGRDVKLIG